MLLHLSGACYYYSNPSIYPGSLLLLLLSFHILRVLVTTTPILPYTEGACYYSYPSIYSGELVTTPPILKFTQGACYYSSCLSKYPESLLLLLSFHILRELITDPPVLPYTQGACYYSHSSIYSGELVTTHPILPYTQGACYYSSYP